MKFTNSFERNVTVSFFYSACALRSLWDLENLCGSCLLAEARLQPRHENCKFKPGFSR
jgi:hypothetical protein